MKKILSILASLTFVINITVGLVSCIPSNDGGGSLIGNGVYLNILNWNTWKNNSQFSLISKYVIKIDNNQNIIWDFKNGIKQGIQEFYTSTILWDQVDITITPTPPEKNGYNFDLTKLSVVFKAKSNATSLKGEGHWKDVNILADLNKWVSDKSTDIIDKDDPYLKKKIIEKLLGSNRDEKILTKLKVVIKAGINNISVEADGTNSNFFTGKVTLNYKLKSENILN